jgi:hypothetical protein
MTCATALIDTDFTAPDGVGDCPRSQRSYSTNWLPGLCPSCLTGREQREAAIWSESIPQLQSEDVTQVDRQESIGTWLNEDEAYEIMERELISEDEET